MSAKFRRLAAWVPAVVAAVCCANAQAQFAARDLNADGVTDAYYDAANNISWLADANTIVSSNYVGVGDPKPFEDYLQGLVTGVSAQTWADGLNVHGVTGWRLPQVFQPAPTECEPYTSQYCGGWVVFDSELSELYAALGGGSGPFANVQSGYYLTAMYPEYGVPGNHEFMQLVHMGTGARAVTDEVDWIGAYAWAVHDGDVGAAVSPVPEPATTALFGAGLGLLAWVVRRRRAD